MLLKKGLLTFSVYSPADSLLSPDVSAGGSPGCSLSLNVTLEVFNSCGKDTLVASFKLRLSSI